MPILYRVFTCVCTHTYAQAKDSRMHMARSVEYTLANPQTISAHAVVHTQSSMEQDKMTLKSIMALTQESACPIRLVPNAKTAKSCSKSKISISGQIKHV